nr:protein kinase [candidate division Zixibacteria bacterium]
MTLENGQNLAHFKILRKLGEGGMGEVYLAEDQKLNRKVAIKILQAEFFDNPERKQRFIREAKTAAKISHPNVTAIYDLDTAVNEKTGQEISYIVMEYISGESLSTVLKEKTLNLSELLRIAGKIAAGLAAAHKLNIVHRDIKTDNIKIDDDGEPRILDFGLAKPLDLTTESGDPQATDTISKELTQEGKILGTVSYMSPEQARGQAIDSRSDIFSFGILLYRMFSGEYPFDGSDRVSILAKTLEARHTPVRQKNENLPAELERIIDKCLQKDPNDRYQDTRDLVVDLRTLRKQFDSGVSDSISGISEAISIPVKPTRLWRYLGIVAAFLMVAAVLIYMLRGQSGPKQQLQAKANALAILGFENKTGDSDLDWLQSGLPEILMTDLAQNGSINLISRNRVLDCLDDNDRSQPGLPDHQACMKAARSIGATRVLSGSFIRMGEQIRIDARVEDVESGKILIGEKAVGDSPLILVDSLTRKIAQALNLKEILANDRGVAELTSSSSEAYKEYILGMDQFSNLSFDEANKHFEKAIEIDSTFALPYMRIGMTYAMQGRGQKGVPYFTSARRFEHKLPVKDKSLLDIYCDIWLNADFDKAVSKMQSFVANYPHDKEARAVYALLLYSLVRDPQASIAQLDTVIMLDPHFFLAYSWYVEVYAKMGDYDQAIEYARKMKEYYPESVEASNTLADLYFAQFRLDEASFEYQAILDKYPENKTAIRAMMNIAILGKEFGEAEKYVEMLKEYFADDPYQMIEYYNRKANLCTWAGRFGDGLDMILKGCDYAMQIGDSTRIFNQKFAMSGYFEMLGQVDSALYYGKLASYYASQFQTLSYPIQVVSISRKDSANARSLFRDAVTNFKARTPKEIWTLVDRLEIIFNGYIDADTAALIRGYHSIVDDPDYRSTGDLQILGRLEVLTGKYREGIETLSPVISGKDETANGFVYLMARYYLGVACEALGDNKQAAEHYSEIMKYWSRPQIEMREINDARKRLDRLTG